MRGHRFCSSIVVGVAATLVVSAAQEPPSAWPQLHARMEQAVLSDDAATLRQVRAAWLQILSASPAAGQVPLVRYDVAYAGWRMAFNPMVPGKEQEALLDEAIDHLTRALKADDRFAEGYGLLAGVYGAKIGKSPMIRGMVLGPRAGTTMDRAAALEPNNPRIVMQQGVSAFNTPAMFGGGNAKAEALLRRSIDLFEQEPADKAWPNWGRFDAHAWLGQALLKKGDAAGARAEYDKALAIAPKSGWLHFVLIPQLQNKSGAARPLADEILAR